MKLGSWLDCVATRESLMFDIQNRYGPIIGIQKLTLFDLAKLLFRFNAP